MLPAEITNYLDDKISELAKSRLPDEPGYPSGETQYASFIMPKDEMNALETKAGGNKPASYKSNERSNVGWSGRSKSPAYVSQDDSKNGDTDAKRKEPEEMPRSYSSSSVAENKLPSILSPTLPSIFALDSTSIIPMALSPTLPGAFQPAVKSESRDSPSSPPPKIDTPASTDRKRKRTDTPSTASVKDNDVDETTPIKAKKSPPPPIQSTTPNSAKKSVSLNEYKKRKNASSNGPLTPTLQKVLPSEVDSPRQAHHENSESPSSNATKSTDKIADAKSFTEKSQRYLAKGTSLKREADKSSRSDPVLAAVIATHAILNFISAFSCDDSSRKIRGKLALHENWKTTSEFIVWVINLVRDTKETELEGLCHQLHAICTQRLFENQQRYLRSSHKSWEDKRVREEKPLAELDATFWKIWTEAHGHYFTICKSLKAGQSKLNEQALREKFPKTWREREFWGSEMPAQDGEFGSKYRLPLSMSSNVAEAVGFAQSILKEFVQQRGIKHSMIE